jgi:hypothetical protein
MLGVQRQLHSPAGQEHGRTILLADIGFASIEPCHVPLTNVAYEKGSSYKVPVRHPLRPSFL